MQLEQIPGTVVRAVLAVQNQVLLPLELFMLCVCVYVIFVPESTVYLCNVWCAGGLFVMWLDGGDEWVRYEKNESLKKMDKIKVNKQKIKYCINNDSEEAEINAQVITITLAYTEQPDWGGDSVITSESKTRTD